MGGGGRYGGVLQYTGKSTVGLTIKRRTEKSIGFDCTRESAGLYCCQKESLKIKRWHDLVRGSSKYKRPYNIPVSGP